ncbi:MAG TPA: hypothetical protein VM434_12780 [Beijerinckiaceae bacterium]|nr:hypothetical protein [Beijerinckiaceae bacterium]
MVNLVAGLLGVVGVLTYIGVLAWSVRAVPFTVIAASVVLLLVFDFVRTQWFGEEEESRPVLPREDNPST